MNILICLDDEKLINICKSNLETIAPKYDISMSIETVSSGKSLLFFEDTKFAKLNLIYIDTELPDMDGIEVAKKLQETGTTADIVLYSKDISRAIDGYDVSALHYMIKEETSTEKFEEIFVRACERNKKKAAELLTVSCAGVHKQIPVEDILYFSVANRIITVNYQVGDRIETFDFYSSLSKIEEFLFAKRFTRIHGSYLVSNRHIRTKSNKEVVMSDGHTLPIGRTYKNNLKDL